MKTRSPGQHETVISNNHCGQLDPAAHVASIHSMAENNFLEAVFTNGFIGLFQPGYGPYNPGLYRWEDGTPLSFVYWDRGFHLKPQPNNDRPIERLTRLRKNKKFHGWHDWFAGGLDWVICKKPATKIPAPAAPPVPAIPPTSAAPKLPIKPQTSAVKVTPAPLKFSDAENGKVPAVKTDQTPASLKFSDSENAKVPPVKPEQLVDPPKKSSQGKSYILK
uniref:C-type lectin domain-containing protein n=1 Tax=Panagrolaimus davidi TaxID=227884 RepID=A0A914NZM8_9BILA